MVDMNAQGGLPHPLDDSQFYRGVAMRRGAAWLIDEALGWGLGFGLALLFGVATLGIGLLAFAPVMAGAAFLYRWVSLARWSATPAMRLLGLEIRAFNGERLTTGEALIHTGAYYICVATGIGQILSIGMMALGPMGRGVGDTLLGSTAINRPA